VTDLDPGTADDATTEGAGRPAVGFNHHSDEYAADPIGYVRGLCPVSRSETLGGFYVATAYDAVVQIGRNPAIFTPARDADNRNGIPPRLGAPYPKSPLELEGTEFLQIRRLLEPLLRKGEVAAMADGITYYTNYFLDQVIESGEMELVRDYAAPVPASISIDWYGLAPAQHWEFFAKRFGDQQRTTPGTPEFDDAMRGLEEVSELLGRETGARREHPRDDVLTKIANGVLDGEPISDQMATGTSAFLLSGGVNTTAIFTAHALIYLSEHRDEHDRLREDDQFLRSAFEELLRLATPVLSTSRRVTEPVTLAGVDLEPGDPVLVCWGAANRDPSAFPSPDEVDLHRWPNKHVAFGAGMHRCVGANLAVAMATQMLRTVLTRIPDFRVVEVVDAANRSTDNGFATVRVEFGEGERMYPSGSPEPQFHTAD
jgi:cytochrome P450